MFDLSWKTRLKKKKKEKMRAMKTWVIFFSPLLLEHWAQTQVNSIFEDLYTLLCLATGVTASLWRQRRRLGRRSAERKGLQQHPSFPPSVRGDDCSLHWLISRLIWQDMFDLIKAFREKEKKKKKRKTTHNNKCVFNRYPLVWQYILFS